MAPQAMAIFRGFVVDGQLGISVPVQQEYARKVDRNRFGRVAAIEFGPSIRLKVRHGIQHSLLASRIMSWRSA
jgi:hypothetical protein